MWRHLSFRGKLVAAGFFSDAVRFSALANSKGNILDDGELIETLSVSKVKATDGSATDFNKTKLARWRPDGSRFETIGWGPCNIWGLVLDGNGQAWIQEANDFGYPVMPFHEYAYYPGGMEALKKSYQPDFPPQAEFRMGGTGLSGLALIESGPLKDKEAAHTMAVANPIISKIQTIAMHRDGAWWRLAQLPDLITCDDPFFRPVALTNGPDGCIYIVDWYNKIISHNEVPRAHPDRDKTRGRIWRVKPKAAKTEVADFTKMSTEELVSLLGTAPIGRSHLAWQELVDRKQLPATHFAAQEYLVSSPFGQIHQIGRHLSDQNIAGLLAFAKPSLTNGPTIPSSRGAKQIPVREAYDHEFERFLVRMFLERHPEIVAKFLDSEASAKLPVEARVLASLALEPKASASRVAKLLPQLDRAPNDEELLRLAQFPAEAGVGEALQALLTNEKSRSSVVAKLLVALPPVGKLVKRTGGLSGAFAWVALFVVLWLYSPWYVVFAAGLIVSIVLHEFGHFWTARKSGMKATQFFLFMGPKLWSFRRGETEFGIRALPLGAFVKVPGMHSMDAEVDPATAPPTAAPPAAQLCLVPPTSQVIFFTVSGESFCRT